MQQCIGAPRGGGGRVSWLIEQPKQRHGGTKVHTQSMVGLAGSALRQWQMGLWEGGESKGNGGSEMGAGHVGLYHVDVWEPFNRC